MRAEASPSTMVAGLSIRTLTDGGQAAPDVARELAEFLAGAERSLDVAIYDLKLRPETAAIVGGAIQDAAARGVSVRIVYNVEHPNPIPVPPPPEPTRCSSAGSACRRSRSLASRI